MVFVGCSKKDFLENKVEVLARQKAVVDQFLKAPTNVSDELLFFINDIKKSNDTNPFLFEFVQRNGMPVWDQITGNIPIVKSSSNNSSGIVSNSFVTTYAENSNKPSSLFVPLIDTISKEITSYIYCTKSSNGTTSYKVYNKKAILNTKANDLNFIKTQGLVLTVFAHFERQLNKKQETPFPAPYNYQFKNALVSFSPKQSMGAITSNSIIEKQILEQSNGSCIEQDLYISYDEINGTNIGYCSPYIHLHIYCRDANTISTIVSTINEPCPKTLDGGGGGTTLTPIVITNPGPAPSNPVDLFLWLSGFPVPAPSPNPPPPNSGGGYNPNPGSNLPPNWQEDPNIPWFDSRDRNTSPNNNYVYDPENPYDEITNIIEAPDDPIIENGIEIEEFVENNASFVFLQLRKIGSTNDRQNKEDTTYGYNGNAEGIISTYLNMTDEQLFAKMKDLFSWCTVLNTTTLRQTANRIIEKFKNGPQTPPFEDIELNKAVSNSSALINFVKTFGNELNNKLKISNGNINNVTQIDMGSVRPIFNGLKNKFGGLQILVNDTEKTDIRLKNYRIEDNGNWEADLIIEIEDHFGLDKGDALKYQGKHGGFAAWWVLQQKRNYKPFITKIYVTKKIKGKI